MVLAELAGGVALLLEEVRKSRRPVWNALRRAGHADSQQASAERMLAEDKGGAASGARLLGVSVSEQRTFLGDAINVGRLVAHDAMVVGAYVVDTNVIAPNDKDVGLLLC